MKVLKTIVEGLTKKLVKLRNDTDNGYRLGCPKALVIIACLSFHIVEMYRECNTWNMHICRLRAFNAFNSFVFTHLVNVQISHHLLTFNVTDQQWVAPVFGWGRSANFCGSALHTRRWARRLTTALFLWLLQRRHTPLDWEKVPFVPRPSLVADPITAFGKREIVQPRQNKLYILTPQGRASIKPSQVVLSQPIKEYISARDTTRAKVLSAVKRQDLILDYGAERAALPDRQHMDVVLPQLHRTMPVREKTRVFYSNYASY